LITSEAKLRLKETWFCKDSDIEKEPLFVVWVRGVKESLMTNRNQQIWLEFC